MLWGFGCFLYLCVFRLYLYNKNISKKDDRRYIVPISLLFQTFLRKRFEEETLIKTQSTIPLQIFREFQLNSKVISKNTIIPDVYFQGDPPAMYGMTISSLKLLLTCSFLLRVKSVKNLPFLNCDIPSMLPQATLSWICNFSIIQTPKCVFSYSRTEMDCHNFPTLNGFDMLCHWHNYGCTLQKNQINDIIRV